MPKTNKSLKPFDQCPICGGEITRKEVEKLLRGGGNTASVRVKAEVCLKCGERYYSQETVQRFEEIRQRLRKGEVADYRRVGESFDLGEVG